MDLKQYLQEAQPVIVQEVEENIEALREAAKTASSEEAKELLDLANEAQETLDLHTSVHKETFLK